MHSRRQTTFRVFTQLFTAGGIILCSLFFEACSAQQFEPTDPPVPASSDEAATPAEPPPIDPDVPAAVETQQPSPRFPEASEHKEATLTYRIIDAPNGTFGYDILSDGRLFVHQGNLPGRSGSEGCKSKAEAEKLAAFVIGKIRKGEMPPSVTAEELKALNIH